MSFPFNDLDHSNPIADAEMGARLLDAKMPGWVGKLEVVDTQSPDLVSEILKQLFGGYDAGIAALGLRKEERQRFGFLPGIRTGSGWGNLGDEWHYQIRRRLSQ